MKITISKGATINLGNYESARVDMTVEIDHRTDDLTTLDPTKLEDVIDIYLTKKIEEIQQQAGLPPTDPKRYIG